MHIPHFMRRVNRVFTNPVLGTIAWLVPPLAVVHHVGRRSGRHYRTPVVAFHGAAGIVIPMTYGRDVDWARNIVRAHGCELERLGRKVALRNPRIVGLEAAEPRLPALARGFFRAADFTTAAGLLRAMFVPTPGALFEHVGGYAAVLAAAAAWALAGPNAFDLFAVYRWRPRHALALAAAFGACVALMAGGRSSPFLYFQF